MVLPVAKDGFGYGTTTGVVDWNEENPDPTDSYIMEAIEEFGEGDIGYVIGALRYAKDKGIIHPDMNENQTKRAMEENNLMSIGFDRNMNSAIFDYIWNEKWEPYKGAAKERIKDANRNK